jgi:hypothetical protein
VALFFHHHRLCRVVADRGNAFRESLTRRATRNPDTWRIRRISVIASSQAGEQSFEADDARNGYFTFYLMQTLKKNEGQDSIEKYMPTLAIRFPKMFTKIKMQQNPVLSQSEHGTDT